ncbi:MAG: hypothetical protein HKP25_07355 [Marinicaulis sp.]|nr:hypothetical protein [Marinicaulis sp.]
MAKRSLTIFVSTAAATMLLASPAHAGKKDEPVIAPATIILSAAANADALAALWVEGKRQEIAGLAQAGEFQKDLEKAHKEERKLVEKTNKTVTQADAKGSAYKSLAKRGGDVATPAMAKAEVEALKKAADDWNGAFEKAEKNREKLAQTRTRIDSLTAMHGAGLKSVNDGREKMERAERLSRAPAGSIEIFDPAQANDG